MEKMRKAAAAAAAAAKFGLPLQRAQPQPSPEAEPQPPAGSPQDDKLWLAAKEAKADEVASLLEVHGISVEYAKSEVDPESKYFVDFKNRPLERCQAIHVAAYFRKSKESKDDASVKSPARVVELLLAAKASPTAEAFCHTEGEDGTVTARKLQPIHLAASAGNNEVIKLLLANNVHPDTPAEISARGSTTTFKPHYMPIHDATWFKHANTVKFLLERRANISAANKDQDTALHLAARLGYVEIVQLLLPCGKDGGRQSDRPSGDTAMSEERHCNQKLLDMPNQRGQVALEVAVEAGRFNLSKLYVFTDAMEDAALLRAFVKVARACPEAASALLRSKGTLDDADEAEGIIDDAFRASAIDRRYRECMQREAAQAMWKRSSGGASEEASGGGNARFDVLFFADLVRNAPQAAVDVLDALTDTPDAVNQEHHPLPIRAHLPQGSDFCPLTCVYEDDLDWYWSPKVKKYDGGKRWHQVLAPLNPQKNHEVDVRVVKMPGLADPAFLGSLAHAGDNRMFTKLPVHALLKFVWKELHGLLIMDLACEAVAIVVISVWIVNPVGVELPTLVSRLAWCCVAAQGVLESTHLTCTCARYMMQPQLDDIQDKLDKWARWKSLEKMRGGQAIRNIVEWFLRKRLIIRDTVEWFLRNWHRALLALSTVALAISSQDEHWPDGSPIVSAILGITSFLHWANVLYELRAFQWTGQRLLPIMNSVPQIGGMLVILIFLLVGFLHAFWAMERSAVDEGRLWQILTFLFIGDNFIDEEELQPFGFEKRSALVMLGGFGVFTFTVCAMNLFIAVLGDIYDQQQEQTICTFLKERARICCSLFMRPELEIVPKLPPLTSRRSVAKVLLFVFTGVASFALALWFCAFLEVTSWPAAIVLAAWGLLLQLSMRRDLTFDWKKRHLWFCTSTTGAEEMFSLAQEQQEKMKTQGRVSKLKRFIRDTIRNELATFRKDLLKQEGQKRPSVTAGKEQRNSGEQKRPSGGSSAPPSEVEKQLRAEIAELRSQGELQQQGRCRASERQVEKSSEAQAIERLERKIDELAAAAALAPRHKKSGRSSRDLVAAQSPLTGQNGKLKFTIFGPGLLVDEGEEDFSGAAARPLIGGGGGGGGDAPSRFAFLRTCG